MMLNLVTAVLWPYWERKKKLLREIKRKLFKRLSCSFFLFTNKKVVLLCIRQVMLIQPERIFKYTIDK